MNREREIKEKIKDFNKQIEYNNTANERMRNQINSWEEDLMILEKPKMLESDLEIMVKDLADIVSTILDSTSDNINDFNPEFTIGYKNEVSQSRSISATIYTLSIIVLCLIYVLCLIRYNYIKSLFNISLNIFSSIIV